MSLVRESISFKRGLDPKAALGVGLESLSSWEVHDYLVKLYSKDFYVVPSPTHFEISGYYNVIWHIQVFPKELEDEVKIRISRGEINSLFYLLGYKDSSYEYRLIADDPNEYEYKYGLGYMTQALGYYKDKKPTIVWRGDYVADLIAETDKLIKNNI